LKEEPPISEPFLTRDETLIATLSAAIRSVTGLTPELSTGGGTSDARFIRHFCPVVEFGLVGTTMHQVDERVTLVELQQASLIYERFLDGYFAR
jgi:succinyl-diaminopimelate desuccinylase